MLPVAAEFRFGVGIVGRDKHQQFGIRIRLGFGSSFRVGGNELGEFMPTFIVLDPSLF